MTEAAGDSKAARKDEPWDNTVPVASEDGIAWVTMNRPDKRSAMNPVLNREMNEALDALEVAAAACPTNDTRPTTPDPRRLTAALIPRREPPPRMVSQMQWQFGNGLAGMPCPIAVGSRHVEEFRVA